MSGIQIRDKWDSSNTVKRPAVIRMQVSSPLPLDSTPLPTTPALDCIWPFGFHINSNMTADPDAEAHHPPQNMETNKQIASAL